MERIKALITDYERCLSRIRACGQPVKDRQRRNDIQRILYSRGPDREYDADMLYTLFQGTPPERITAIRQELQAKNWHLTPKEQREDFLAELIPELERYYPLFSDFRFGGYRVLIDPCQCCDYSYSIILLILLITCTINALTGKRSHHR